jgi:hypothetical protein
MTRNRRRKKPLWMIIATWAVILLIAGWGLWQFADVLKTVLAQRQQSATAEDPAPNDSKSPPPTTIPATTHPTDALILPPPLANDTAPLPDDAPPTTAPLSTEDPTDLISKATALLDNNRTVEGRTLLNTALSLLEDDPRAPHLRQQLTDLNTPIFLGSAILPDDPAAHLITIESGDSFLKLARKYSVPAQLLEIINPSLNPRNLKPLTGMKIIQGPFNLRLVKHAARLDLYLRDLYIRSFPIQLEDGNFLPRGAYRIKPATKIQLTPLRTWIGFHGTDSTTRDITLGWLYGSPGPRASNDDQTSGIKLADADLAQLYNVLVESHSTLHVVP